MSMLQGISMVSPTYYLNIFFMELKSNFSINEKLSKNFIHFSFKWKLMPIWQVIAPHISGNELTCLMGNSQLNHVLCALNCPTKEKYFTVQSDNKICKTCSEMEKKFRKKPTTMRMAILSLLAFLRNRFEYFLLCKFA